MNIAADVSINTISDNPNYNRFYAYQYAGVLDITNIILPVQSGYIYDMQLVMNFSNTVSNNFTTYFGTKPSITFAYLNTTYETTQLSPLNCKITNPIPVPEPIPSFSLTGY